MKKHDNLNDDPSLSNDVREQLLRDSEPFGLTNFFIKSPCCCVITQLILLFALTGAAYQLGYFELTPQNDREFLIWTDPRAVAWDKLLVAEKELLATSAGEGDQPLRMTTVRKWNPMILYESKPGGNILLK